MPRVTDIYTPPTELVLGTRLNTRVPEADQKRQRAEAVEILRRLRNQPGVVLADEVGMGKTFVALAVAYSVATRSPRGPVLVMVPPNLIEKWEQDLKTFCDLYLDGRRAVLRDGATREDLTGLSAVRYGVARNSVDLMKLLDDPRRERCHLIFVGQGAMARRQTDKWVRLALIAEALRRHGRGGAERLIQVKKQIHRFLGQLLYAIGEERATDLREDLWPHLLKTDPVAWKTIYNEAIHDPTQQLPDDPVPKAVTRALRRLEIGKLADALKGMPVRAVGGLGRVAVRVNDARVALKQIEDELWRGLLANAPWRSPLLIMDEAHHLKNPGTALARSLQSPESNEDLQIGDGAMARRFDRMLFLTATPFQLGHRELVRILERFGDVRWDESELGSSEDLRQRLNVLGQQLDESQRTAVGLQRSWMRLRHEDCLGQPEEWWSQLQRASHESQNSYQRAVLDAFGAAKCARNVAQRALRPWILRHNNGTLWEGTKIARRQRITGANIVDSSAKNGLPIPPEQLLPFFLAARGAAATKHDLLGEALSSSYEAFRFTRQNKDEAKDDEEQKPEQAPGTDLSNSGWYLHEFDRALEKLSGLVHPKVSATVRKVVDLWEAGEKVLVFAFYRRTCHSLRYHVGREIERRVLDVAQNRLRTADRPYGRAEVESLLARIQKNFFDAPDSPGRRALDAELRGIMGAHADAFAKAKMPSDRQDELTDVMRRFLRVETTLVRCFPLAKHGSIKPAEAVASMLDQEDGSGVSWRQKFSGFIEFLTERCVASERDLFVEAARQTRTGRIRVDHNDDEDSNGSTGSVVLANVQVATGRTPHEVRARLMRAFNTPFFPDIFVCSEVMGEGVDLQRFCRHVIHHDLAWNPSTVEQRTGRIDRLGCKAERRNPITVYLPYLSGAADERQFQVMSEREQWFRVVMGQDAVAKLITTESQSAVPLPASAAEALGFDLSLRQTSSDVY